MTRLNLAEIEARAKAATEGPWHSGDTVITAAGAVDTCPGARVWAAIVRCELVEDTDSDGRIWKTGGTQEGNVEFIAHARQDIPDLIAHIRELETALGEKNEEVVTRLEQRMERELDKRLPNG